jgi:uncharacterized protein
MIADMRKQLFTFLFVMLGWALLPSAVGAITSNLVISEVQTQSGTSTTQEFVELYNRSASAVDVTGWKVEYVSATGGTTSPIATLSGSVPGHSFVLLSRTGFLAVADYFFSVGLAEAGGHVRVVDASKQVIDLVGWGTAVSPEGLAVPPPSKGFSLRREVDTADLFKDTDNNALDFVAATPDPRTGLREMPPAEDPEPEPEPEVPPPTDPPLVEEPPTEPDPTPEPVPEQPPQPETPPTDQPSPPQDPLPIPQTPTNPPQPPSPAPSPHPARPCWKHKTHWAHHFVKKYLAKIEKHKRWNIRLQQRE